jgi:hypothetical protein
MRGRERGWGWQRWRRGERFRKEAELISKDFQIREEVEVLYGDAKELKPL